ncbi:MAG: hypothetical protein AAGK32_12915, partial [Actinomycetota bacterium]
FEEVLRLLLLEAVELEVRRRRFGRAVRLEIDTSMSQEVKDLLVRELDVADDDEGIRRSNEAMMNLASTEDFAEGPTAFIEKRDPVWKGR